jgi:L-alanine-DL-glutamate epimerase-like enolase superfamily enzyme
MEIIDIRVRVVPFTSHEKRDSQGHQHVCPPYQSKMALLTIVADDGSEGHCFCAPEIVRPYIVQRHLDPILMGQDPFQRERLWHELVDAQRSSGGQLTDKTVGIVETALWDLAGRKFGTPVYKLIGSYRDKVRAYASIMCGDENEGGLATPEDYARFAEKLVKQGYKGIKLHTWCPPLSWAPDPKVDAKACAAVREAVGPDIALMLDPYHRYSRSDALWLGRQIQALDFVWYEEPMYEGSISSYAWLAENLDIPILGPETIEGRHQIRAEWAKTGACDILRTGVADLGGITASLKVCGLAESFGMDCEIHHAGPGALVLCAVAKNVGWYERGLLHPFLDYEAVPEYLNRRFDEMDGEGYVHMPQIPGVGFDINFEYIDNHALS